MAKMFYSEEEAAAKLGITTDELENRAKRGELERLMNLNKPVYKVVQIDMLAGGGDDGGIPLADSGSDDAITLADSSTGQRGTGESTKERSGISIFEADELEDTTDGSAQTQITGSIGGVKVGDSSGSGSGLLDLTRDSKDDTGIGAGILGDTYDQDSQDIAGTPVDGSPAIRNSAGNGAPAMFEDAGVASDVAEPAGAQAGGMMMVPAESIDKLSGLVGGLALGMSLVSLFSLAVVAMAVGGLTGGLLGIVAGNFLAVVSVLVVLVVIAAVAGMFLGRSK